MGSWTNYNVSADATFTSELIDGIEVLKIEKTALAHLSFLEYHFTYSFGSEIKPTHLMFEFYSSSVETEDTNLRLMNVAVIKEKRKQN